MQVIKPISIRVIDSLLLFDKCTGAVNIGYGEKSAEHVGDGLDAIAETQIKFIYGAAYG